MFSRQTSADVTPQLRKRLMSELSCIVCKKLSADAVQTDCCKVIGCSSCITSQCPSCDKDCKPSICYLARRMLANQTYTCPKCNSKMKMEDIGKHKPKCLWQLCPVTNCHHVSEMDAFLRHVITAHKLQIMHSHQLLFDKTKQQQEEERRKTERRRLHHEEVARQRSRNFVEVTGKNYCCGQLNGAPCECCDGRCGPNNGCNCVNCMRLDLSSFNVTGPRTLVNREGAVAKISSETGKFYCGRNNMQHDNNTDGVCGPNNGNNCHSCWVLDVQVQDRYSSIAAEW